MLTLSFFIKFRCSLAKHFANNNFTGCTAAILWLQCPTQRYSHRGTNRIFKLPGWAARRQRCKCNIFYNAFLCYVAQHYIVGFLAFLLWYYISQHFFLFSFYFRFRTAKNLNLKGFFNYNCCGNCNTLLSSLSSACVSISFPVCWMRCIYSIQQKLLWSIRDTCTYFWVETSGIC